MKTEIITENIEAAAEIISSGGLVAVPTETVYGLAGNGLCHDAVAQIYEVKGRPEVKPLSLMVPDAGAMERYCLDVPEQAKFLAKKYWPGPLTIVLKSKPEIPEIVRAGGDTVGLRCPDHPLTLRLLRACGLPLAAPSANPSGAPSPKTAKDVLSYFDGKIDAVIDGGECGLGRESTIIDLSAAPYRILRQGALPEGEIEDALVGEMRIIGITGGSGAGKTTALNVLRDMGALTIDCDEVYHRLTEESAEMRAEIEDRFGVVYKDGRLDRKALGSIVFGDKEALLDLNGITHKYIGAELDRLLRGHAMSGGRLAGVDAVELISGGASKRCTRVFGVIAPHEKRLERITAREGISREYAEMRLKAQKSDDYYMENCDGILFNNGELNEFAAVCRAAFEEEIG
ncbi:MAG: threonylcarbamoyl-AMP synthase [Clostridia bacterium]|nr:threonylcarbamoyl-AMP synthase [Clostridia bacterium]